MQRLIKKTGIFLSLILLGSCSYQSEEMLFPKDFDDCDTDSISYASDLLPILEASCFSCHSTVNAPLSSGINLEGADRLAEKANDQSLLGALQHRDGYTPMPADAPQLDSCSIEKFKSWVNDGAKNN